MSEILVIDDDEVFLAIISNILQEEGFKVRPTADGPQGITIYREKRPDVVVLDIGLPSMNGLEVLRRIREFDKNARIVVVTGYGSSEWRDEAFRYGACDFIVKPFEPGILIDRVKAALSGRFA